MSLERRTELRRTGGPKRKTELRRGGKLRAKSPKQKALDVVLKRNSARVMAEAEGRCVVKVSGVCQGFAVEVHHTNRRRGAQPHAVRYLVPCCTPCHQHIHANPDWSVDAGWLLRSSDVPLAGQPSTEDSPLPPVTQHPPSPQDAARVDRGEPRRPG